MSFFFIPVMWWADRAVRIKEKYPVPRYILDIHLSKLSLAAPSFAIKKYCEQVNVCFTCYIQTLNQNRDSIIIRASTKLNHNAASIKIRKNVPLSLVNSLWWLNSCDVMQLKEIPIKYNNNSVVSFFKCFFLSAFLPSTLVHVRPILSLEMPCYVCQLLLTQ